MHGKMNLKNLIRSSKEYRTDLEKLDYDLRTISYIRTGYRRKIVLIKRLLEKYAKHRLEWK